MKNFYTCFLVLLSMLCWAQETDSIKGNTSWAVSTGAEYGTVLPTNIHLESYPNRGYTGYSFQFLKQATGAKDWEKLYNYPQYGIGFFAFDFLENKQMGSPFAVYGIYNAKIKQWGKLKWSHHINFGISFNSNPFDLENRYYNTSVGSKTNMFISVGTGLYYEMGKHFDLGLNLKFNHLSNGSLKIPNKGLNSVAPQLSLVYYPERVTIKRDDSVTTNNKKYNTLEFSVFAGRKDAFYKGERRDEIKLYDGFDYSIYGTEAFYLRQYSAKSAYGIGIGITKDEEYNNTMYVSDSTLYQKKRFSHSQLLFSVIPTYRLMIGNLYVNVGAGYYAFKKTTKYDKTAFFQRIGLQYQFTDRLFASFGINAYDFHVANYLEWKLGYTFSKKARK
ncbi:acyloxyacyl hydrolase [Chryseobacterium camelliae]|uniref:Acyloxyacyl hydrolase n=1 Tax=Chryseobacterium camelliae TaxID=1265445 RepID=A0ABY7QM33_9FLAO|nr:acyloxyacyl hydrolase [Chryseobacterium camelliae]WBV60298.1 acyloxyacyl hydrolase [Chryseobacterium camelliae]